MSSFTDNSWQVAREYDTRVISDIESGSKSWCSLSKGLETDALYCANQTVDLKNKSKVKTKDNRDPKKRKPVLLITHIVFPTTVIGSIITGEKRVFSSIIARGVK